MKPISLPMLDLKIKRTGTAAIAFSLEKENRSKMLDGVRRRLGPNPQASGLIMTGAILSCVIQLFWFADKCFNEINMDGLAYTGIAHHLRQGEFHASINAFRSPLISWLIAALALVRADYLHIGKIVSICSFLLCLPLLYVFASRLWDSSLVASLAVLLLTLGRGIMAVAVASVTPDFLFSALVLAYFIILLRCMRNDGLRNWFYAGAIHGLAFLAKSFALPWLGVCTAVAVLLSDKSWNAKFGRLAIGGLVPVIAAAGWAAVLHSKYGVYTTGSQFKTNLLQWTLHEDPQHLDETYALLTDTTKGLDTYMVGDPMPPGSSAWTYHVSAKQGLSRLIFAAERKNVPKALKELTIVATPGVLIAFVIMLAILTRRRYFYPVEWRVTVVITASAVSLVIAYSMLVFDERYLFPLLSLILTIGARFLVADPELNHTGWRRITVALVILGVCVSLVYPSSTFRVLTRDFQVVAYRAGEVLRNRPGRSTIVSLGSGPFPEHGVGWEAGYQAAYFGGGRLIGTMESLPSSTQLATVMTDLRKARPDAIVVWGSPSDSKYADLVRSLVSQYPYHPVERITDPVVGEAGIILFITR